MVKYLVYPAIFFIVFLFFKCFLNNKSKKASEIGKEPLSQRPTNISIDKKKLPQSIEHELSFEEQWNTGPLLCDGTICNSKNPCSPPERWLCRDVVSKAIPAGYFTGQFWLSLQSGSRRVDFAIETPEGKRIVVELDGYATHVETLERDDFDDQLLRQNELVYAGWTVVRFSFDQLRKDASQCVQILRDIATNERSSFNRSPVLFGPCLVPGCGGRAKRLKSKENKFFWKCPKCEKTFNNEKISPSVSPI